MGSPTGRGLFCGQSGHMGAIVPTSDRPDANTLHTDGKKSYRIPQRAAWGLLIIAALSACEPVPDEQPEVADVPVVAEPSCGPGGRLTTELFGSIAKYIDWASDEVECQSMLRPEGKGVRLRFTGNAANNRLAIILALPELQRGSTGAESPTVVTLTVEGSGRFFSTPSLDACWSDISNQDPVEPGGDRYDVSGTLYCVTPLGEINGNAAISIPKLEFRGILDWSVS